MISFSQCWSGDCKNGYGDFIYDNGDTYSGEWKDGVRYGIGTYISRIHYLSPSEDIYVGEWKDGKMHGQGTYTYVNGDKYVGEWKDGKCHGLGTHTYTSGSKYLGESKDDKRNGQGTYTYANGDKYVGEWKDDKRDGQGAYTEANGTVTKGLWENDEFFGFGQDNNPDMNKEELKEQLIELYPESKEMIENNFETIDEDVLKSIYNVTIKYYSTGKSVVMIADLHKLRVMIADLLTSSKPYLIDELKNEPSDLKWKEYVDCVYDYLIKDGITSIETYYAHPNPIELGGKIKSECSNLLQ